MQERSGAGATPQQDLTDEEKVRQLVRDMWATPDGRAALEALFEPFSKMTEDEREAAVKQYFTHTQDQP